MRNAILITLLALAATAAPHYRVARHIVLGGDGGWDYLNVDNPSHRLFVSRADRVMVVDLESGKLISEIPNTPGVHGIAIARDLKRGFISAGRANNVVIFDLETLKQTGDVKTGERPDAIMFERTTSRVFTFNAGTKDSTAIDAKSGSVAGTIPLGGKPEFAVADGKGHVFVNVEDTGEVAEIDAKELKVVKRWKLAGCDDPSGLAIDRAHRRLFSACGSKVMAISDADAGKEITTLPIGEGVDGAMFDPEHQMAFASNGASGTITAIHESSPEKFEVAETVTTQRGARTIVIDEKTHHLYLPTAQFGEAPAPTPETPRPRRPIVAGTFEIIDVAP